jgi:hypothetical protein
VSRIPYLSVTAAVSGRDADDEPAARGEGTLQRPAAVGPVLEDAFGQQDPDGHRLAGVRVHRGEK